MAVESVNSSNGHPGFIGGLLGGAAGAIKGYYYTKPAVKNDIPTDLYTKAVYDEIVKNPEENGYMSEILDRCTKQMTQNTEDAFKNAKSGKDVKARLMKRINEAADKFKDVESLKNYLKDNCYVSQHTGVPFDPNFDVIEDLTTNSEVVKAYEKHYDSVFEGKTLEEAKSLFIKDGEKLKTGIISGSFKRYWEMLSNLEDGGQEIKKRIFKNADDRLGPCFKDAADSLKPLRKKYALIYGLVGALATGIVSKLLFGRKSEPVAEEQPTDVQA